MALKPYHIFLFCLICTINFGYTEPKFLHKKVVPSIKENTSSSQLPKELPATENVDDNDINLNIKKEDKVSQDTKNTRPKKGRLAALSIFLLAVVSVYLYMAKIKEPIPEEKVDEILPERVEAPAEVVPVVSWKVLDSAREDLTLEVVNWNMAFDLDYQTTRELDNIVGDRYLEWDDEYMQDILDVIEKQEYEGKFSKQDIAKIVRERQIVLDDKIKLHLGTADPSLVLCSTDAILGATDILEEELNLELTDLRELVDKIDGTELVELEDIDYLAPLKGIKVANPEDKAQLEYFVENCQSILLPYLIKLNNHIAPYAQFIDKWRAKIEQPDEYVLEDYNERVAEEQNKNKMSKRNGKAMAKMNQKR